MIGGQAESNKGYIDIVYDEFEHRKVSPYTTMRWLVYTLPELLPGWWLRVV
jgi:hypothetical protein